MEEKNKLGTESIPKLLRQFAIPSIISMLVTALYNIVDQFFIGQKIGPLGNAATNIVFPFSTSCIALALLFGIGGASAFNLTLGRGDKNGAMYYVGNAISMMITSGICLFVFVEILLPDFLSLFGCPADVYDYAMEYTRITAIGFPFIIFSTGASTLVRADGSPTYSMLCNLAGAIINTILDPILVFIMGMKGAAIATVIGQIISALMVVIYLTRFKTARISKKHLIPNASKIGRISALGATPCLNQVAMMIVQIVLNKSLTYYGKLSSYGDSIPLACAGIVAKVNQIYFSVVIGLSQAMQPILSYNYGARNYERVKKTCYYAGVAGLSISVLSFLAFQIFPRQITAIFGNGSEVYYTFAINYFRIFLFGTFINCLQPMTSNFFTSIGKATHGIFLSLTRQIIFLLPLILIFPFFMGIDGIMYAGPVADIIAAICSVIFFVKESKKLSLT